MDRENLNDIARENYHLLPWCLAPFVSIFHNVNRTAPCCQLPDISIHKSTPLPLNEFIDSKELDDLRKAFLNYDYESLPDTCKCCLKSATSYSEYYTQFGREFAVESFLATRHLYDENGHIEKFPLTGLSLGLSNKCNASCRMCTPMVSSSKYKMSKELGLIPSPEELEERMEIKDNVVTSDVTQFIQLVEDNADTLKEITLHGGDPTQAASLPLLLDALMPHKDKIMINYITNGTFDVLTDGRPLWEILREFRQVNVTFSLDGIPDVNDYIRIGLKSRRTVKLALECKECFGNVPTRYVGINHTLSNYNVYYFTDFLDWAQENTWNKGLWLSMNAVINPTHNSPHNLPKELREKAFEKLNNYKTDNDYFKHLILQAKKALFIRPFNPTDWNVCLWLDKKYDEKTGLSFPLFEPYKANIIEATSWWT